MVNLGGSGYRNGEIQKSVGMGSGARRAPVFVVVLDLTLPGPEVGQQTVWLSDSERLRAGRFVHAWDREIYVATHSLKRRVLTALTGVQEELLRFSCGPYGKPRLQFPVTAIQFNLSHTRDMAVMAWCFDCDVGVDIECIEHIPRHQDDRWERSFLTVEEMAALSLGDARREELLMLWTGKEAVSKHEGVGVNVPFRRLRMQSHKATEKERCWHVGYFRPSKQHSVAIATSQSQRSAEGGALCIVKTLTREDIKIWQKGERLHLVDDFGLVADKAAQDHLFWTYRYVIEVAGWDLRTQQGGW